jgi:hypothetical protein
MQILVGLDRQAVQVVHRLLKEVADHAVDEPPDALVPSDIVGGEGQVVYVGQTEVAPDAKRSELPPVE